MYRSLLFVKLLLPVLLISLISCKDDKAPELVTPESNDPKIKRLKLPEGFRAERLYSPGEHEQGSWVAMTFDDRGRMIVSDQFGGMYRLVIPLSVIHQNQKLNRSKLEKMTRQILQK